MGDFRFGFDATGTRWEVDIQSSKSPSELNLLVDIVKARVESFEQTYSRFRPDSFISVASQKVGVHQLPDDAREMFLLYFELNKITHGLFTPLMGQILEDAGYDSAYSFTDKKTPIPAPDLRQSLSYSYPKLTVRKPVKMDFGACGKGHVIDIIGKLLIDNNIFNFCIDAGGDLLYKNTSPKVLRVGLEDPRDLSQVIGVCNLATGSICGSSGNRRKWKRFHHIINPKTVTSPTAILSTWVVAESAMLADALATCLFFVEPADLSSHFSFEYLILMDDFSVNKSLNFPGETFNA